MCGIFSWSGNDPKKFNKQKFDILGLFNNSRGGDSCGVSTDGEIYYGTVLNKNYDDFVLNKGYIVPLKIPSIIGHSRKASVGVVSETNAHPFGFGTLGEGFEFIGCHNGTLSNYEELAKKYEVPATIYNERNIFVRHKVDSEVLLEILYKCRDTNVLEDYIGGAALVFQDLNEPTKLYAFHGASKKEVGDKDEVMYEERPLYYYQESKNSVYISSMEEALKFIGGVPNETIFEFKHNILYEIENGMVSKAIRHKVDRSLSGQRKGYQSGFSNGGRAATVTSHQSSHQKKSNRKERSKTKRLKKVEDVFNIFDETVIQDDFKSAVYYNRLRYFRNGHLITGVYTYIKEFGFYQLGENANSINEKIYRLYNLYFSQETGDFVTELDLDERLKTDKTLFAPFSYDTKEPPLFYFFEGIMLETSHDYAALTSNVKIRFSFEHLSQMSKYPICKAERNRLPDEKQGIIWQGKPYSDNFMPVQCNNLYYIEDGNLVGIDRMEEEVIKEAENCCSVDFPKGPRLAEVIQLPLKLDLNNSVAGPALVKDTDILDFMEKATIDFLDEDPPIDVFEEVSEIDKTIDLINNHVMPIYEQMQVCNENLKNENSSIVKEIVDLQKEYLISIDCIIESKEK